MDLHPLAAHFAAIIPIQCFESASQTIRLLADHFFKSLLVPMLTVTTVTDS